MDALLTNTQLVTSQYPFWDFQVVGGSVPIISGTEERSQQAAVLAYTQKGLFPQLPNAGINWTALLLNSESLSNIDTQINQALNQAQLPYKPQYKQNKNVLNVNIIPHV